MGTTTTEMKRLVDRCKEAGWSIRRATRGVIVRPPHPRTGQVVIPPRSHGRGLQNVLRELYRLGLEDDEARQAEAEEAARRQKLKEDRASLGVPDSPAEPKDEPMPKQPPPEPPRSAKDVIPLADLGDDVIDRFYVQQALHPAPYNNLVGLAMKPDTRFPTTMVPKYDESNTCLADAEKIRGRVLCDVPNSGCSLTFDGYANARKHTGEVHPTARTLVRRALAAAHVTRLRDIQSRVVEEFLVPMPMPKRGVGGTQYYKKIIGVRLGDGKEYYVCRANPTSCDYASDHLGKTGAHAKSACKPPTDKTPTPPVPVKSAIAKVAAAPRRPAPPPTPKKPADSTTRPTATSTPFAPPAPQPPPATALPTRPASTAGSDTATTVDAGAEFANPDVVNWGHEDELSAMTDTIATLQKSRVDLLRQLRRLEVERDEVRERIREELVVEFREREETLRRQVLAAQEATEAARREAETNRAAAGELAQLKQGLAAAQQHLGGVFGGLFAAPRT